MVASLHNAEVCVAKMYKTLKKLVCSEEVYKMIQDIHAQHANPRTQRTYKSALKTYDVRPIHQPILLQVYVVGSSPLQSMHQCVF